MDKEDFGKVVEWAFDWIKTAEEFMLTQAPLVVQEFFMWFTAVHIMGIVLGLALLLIVWYMHIIGLDPDNIRDGVWFRKARKRMGCDMYDQTDGGWIVHIVIIFIVGMGFVMYHTYNLVYILVAPRLYLMQKLLDFMN